MKSLAPPGIASPLARYAQGVELPPGLRWMRSSGQLGARPDGSIPETAGDQAPCALPISPPS